MSLSWNVIFALYLYSLQRDGRDHGNLPPCGGFCSDLQVPSVSSQLTTQLMRSLRQKCKYSLSLPPAMKSPALSERHPAKPIYTNRTIKQPAEQERTKRNATSPTSEPTLLWPRAPQWTPGSGQLDPPHGTMVLLLLKVLGRAISAPLPFAPCHGSHGAAMLHSSTRLPPALRACYSSRGS